MPFPARFGLSLPPDSPFSRRDVPIIDTDEAQHIIDFEEKKKRFCIRPRAPAFVRVTNRRYGLFVQLVSQPDADGYEVILSADAAGDNVLRREQWPGRNNTEGFVGLGSLNQSVFVRVRALCGDKVSEDFQLGPCGREQVSGTSDTPATSGTGSDSPADTTFNGTETTIASIAITATGRVMGLNGFVRVRSTSAARKNVTLRIKEGSTVLLSKAINISSSGQQRESFSLSTTATTTTGAQTYTLTGENTTDNVDVNAQDITFSIAEVPFTTSNDAAETPPAAITPDLGEGTSSADTTIDPFKPDVPQLPEGT